MQSPTSFTRTSLIAAALGVAAALSGCEHLELANGSRPSDAAISSIFARTEAPGTFEELVRSPSYADNPARAASEACKSYAGHAECEAYLQPRVAEEAAKANQRKAEAAAKQAALREEEAAKKRQNYANPQKAADDLAAAEARLTRATDEFVKLRPQARAEMKQDYAMWRTRTTGLCKDAGADWPAGSTAARIDVTQCWAAYTHMRREWIENAANDMRAATLNVPLRRPQ